MSRSEIPEDAAVLLVRAFGLLLNQVGVYGPDHKVTQNAAASVYKELSKVLELSGVVEFSLRGNQVLVNDSADGIDMTVGRNLLDKMRLYHIESLQFRPLPLKEFLECIKIFGQPPLQVQERGGVAALLRENNLENIKIAAVAYQRVSDVKKESEARVVAVRKVSAPPRRGATQLEKGGGEVLDLSADLDRELEPTAGASEPPQLSTIALCQRNIAQMVELLGEVASLLERSALAPESPERTQMLQLLQNVRSSLERATFDSEKHIATLAEQVDDDRATIDSLESAARKRGIGLKLTRDELMQRYAELQQEITQPLTVSTGVIDMLYSGKGGELSQSQQDMLKLAQESVTRVNQLVSYMQRVTGLPASYTPDRDTIADSYR